MKTMTKRTILSACALVLTTALAAVPARAQAGDAAVAPYINEQTDAVIALDLSQVNIESLNAWATKQIQASGVAKAAQDKMIAQMNNPESAKGKQWLADFTKAGGKKMYVVVSLGGLFMGQPGVLVAPVDAGGNAETIAKFLDPTFGRPAAAAPAPGEEEAGPLGGANAAAVVGGNVVFGPKKTVDALKAGGPKGAAARPEFVAALGGAGNAALRIAIAAGNLGKFPGMDPAAAEKIKGVEWMSIAASTPPTEQVTLTIQAKDAATAKTVTDELNKALGAIQNNPDAVAALGDTKPLVRALTPATAGNAVKVTLDTKTIESVLMPAMIKSGAKEMEQKAGGGGAAPDPTR